MVARVIVRSIVEGGADSGAGSNEAEREFALDGRTITIGRSPACDISLEGDQLASRRHALLRGEGDRYTLVDLGSSNGSFVNDVEIQEPTVLHDGDHLTIGEHDLLFLTSPASPQASWAGVRPMDEPVQAAPMSETNPNASVVHTLASGDAEAQPSAAPASEPYQAYQPYQPSYPAPLAPTKAEERVAPVAPVAPVASAMSAAPSMASGGGDDFDAIRAQLAAASQALAQRADAEARLADQRRSTVAEISARLTDLLTQERASVATQNADLEALAEVARQAANSPKNLDTLNALAARANDLSQALEAQRGWAEKRAALLDALDALRARLDQLG